MERSPPKARRKEARIAMTDAELERQIFDVIKRRGITWSDMVGGPSLRFDQGEEVVFKVNVFKSKVWSERFVELLTPVAGDPLGKNYEAPSLTDLFRYWWNTCADQEDFIDEVLEDLFTYLKDKLTPPPKEEPEPEPLVVDFGEIVSERPIVEVLNLPRIAVGEGEQETTIKRGKNKVGKGRGVKVVRRSKKKGGDRPMTELTHRPDQGP